MFQSKKVSETRDMKNVDKIFAIHTGLHIRFHSLKMILYIKEAYIHHSFNVPAAYKCVPTESSVGSFKGAQVLLFL